MARFEYDVAVIGGGSGGYAAARTAAAAGLKTVVVDGGNEIGGLCILRGCMPTKALLQAAEVLHVAGKAGIWGLQIPRIGFKLARIMERKDALIRDFADYRAGQLQGGQFKFIRARARFESPHVVRLDRGPRIRAHHFVISTGSVVAPPPLPALDQAGYITSDEALQIKRLPRSLIVLGGGAVAVEFAQFFQRLGVRVTLIQRGPHLLRDADPDVGTVLETVFRREGMRIFAGTKLIAARPHGDQKEVTFVHDGKSVRVVADEILLALGRSPCTAGLNLEAAGVASETGRIVTDAGMRTTAPSIYAAGDCTSLHEIVHIAIQQGEIAAHNIAHPQRRRRMDERLLISVVFTDPQIATVGLTMKVAATRGIPVLAASYPFNDHGKSLIMDSTDGFVRLLADPGTGEILGGSCVGPMGGELIHEIVTAMHAHMTVHELAAMPHYHPTLAEIWTYPAEELAGQITGARKRRR